MPHYDMIVIGSGPSGQRAAVQAAKLGKVVAICERRELVGGVCVNTGTIPSKTFREGALYLSGFIQRDIYGQSYVVKENITMGDLVSRCNMVINREVDIIRHQMQRNQVSVIDGRAKFLSDHELEITSEHSRIQISAENIVIAVGTESAHPNEVHIDGKMVVTADEVLDMPTLPRTMTVVGGGVVGMEYASIFAALGVEITIVDGRKRLLEFLDGEIVDSLIYRMRDMECVFRLGEQVVHVESSTPGRVVATLDSGKRVISEALLYSVGRVGATGDLGLEAAGLDADDRGRISVDDSYRTARPHIYAVGDVIGFPSLTSTSMEQGRIAACNAFGVSYTSERSLFPYGIYSVPEIAMVGQTEETLTENRVPYEIGIARYREIARGAIMGATQGLLKILFHRENRKILGVHIIGHSAAELIHIGQSVLAFGGGLDYFVNTVFNYPTLAEAYKVAALDGYNKVGPDDSDTPLPAWN